LVWVRDPGIGVPATDRVRIFERFYKVDRARVRGRGGTGLGLSIARHVVESHGGRIWVESEEGEGSTFTFTIPLAPATTSPATTSPATTSPAAVGGATPEARPGA
jgi:signal transduction histidine kinase